VIVKIFDVNVDECNNDHKKGKQFSPWKIFWREYLADKINDKN